MSGNIYELKPFNADSSQRYDGNTYCSEEDAPHNYTGEDIPCGTDYGTIYDPDEQKADNFFTKHRRSIQIAVASVFLVFFYTSYVLLIPMCVTGQTLSGSDAYAVVLMVAAFSTTGFGLVVLVIKITCVRSIKLRHDQMGLVVGAGVCNLIAFIFVLYAGLPSRTPAHLQVILFTLCVPAAMGARYVILKQNIDNSQWICVVAVLGGVFISLIPRFFPQNIINDSAGLEARNVTNAVYQSTTEEISWLGRILWPLTYGLSYCVTGLFMVITEKLTKVEKPNPLVFVLQCKFITFCGAGLLFWTDFLPGIGMSSDMHEMGLHLKHTLECLLGLDADTCANVTWRLWALNFCGPVGLLMGILVTFYGEGAIFTTLLIALTLPLGTIFWTLFTDTGVSIIWDPKLTIDSIFAFIGLFIILPPMVLYDYFGRRIDVTLSGFTRFQ